jgi:transposase
MGVREVERSLGITYGVLKGWAEASRPSRRGLRGSHAPELSQPELKRLRKANERLQRERDILKKAVAIFSTDPHRYSGYNRAPLHVRSEGDVPRVWSDLSSQNGEKQIDRRREGLQGINNGFKII